MIQAWASSHPDVSVSYQPMLGTVPERFGYIATNLRSETLADVVMQYFPSPAQIDPDLQYDFSADLAAPNPYSDNPTWRDDFPLDGIALDGVTVDDKVVMVGTTYTGDLGDRRALQQGSARAGGHHRAAHHLERLLRRPGQAQGSGHQPLLHAVWWAPIPTSSPGT